MAKRSVAQAGGGDARVLAHPSYRQIPKCEFDLQTEKAQRKYDELALALFEAGCLTTSRHLQLSSYAMQLDVITLNAQKGGTVRAAAFIQLDKALKALKLDEIDRPIAASVDAKTNKFALCGFAARSRSRLQANSA